MHAANCCAVEQGVVNSLQLQSTLAGGGIVTFGPGGPLFLVCLQLWQLCFHHGVCRAMQTATSAKLRKPLHLVRPGRASGLSQVHQVRLADRRPRCSCRAGEAAQEEREAALEQLAAAREDQKTAEDVVANAAAKLQAGPPIPTHAIPAHAMSSTTGSFFIASSDFLAIYHAADVAPSLIAPPFDDKALRTYYTT